MKPIEFFEELAQYGKSGVLTLSPGPFSIRVNENDVAAARLIAKLTPNYQDATIGEFEGVFLNAIIHRLSDIIDDVEDLWGDDTIQTFLSAWWWIVFFVAQYEEVEDESL